jgi:hypothetical protein
MESKSNTQAIVQEIRTHLGRQPNVPTYVVRGRLKEEEKYWQVLEDAEKAALISNTAVDTTPEIKAAQEAIIKNRMDKGESLERKYKLTVVAGSHTIRAIRIAWIGMTPANKMLFENARGD